MKLIGGLSQIGTSIILAIASILLLNSYYGSDEEQLIKYKTLLDHGVIINATSDSNIDETNLSIKGLDIELKEVHYSFKVNDKTFFGSHYLDADEELPSSGMEILYLPNEPGINGYGIKKKYNDLKEDIDSNDKLWFGLFSGGGSLIFMILGIRKVRKWEG